MILNIFRFRFADGLSISEADNNLFTKTKYKIKWFWLFSKMYSKNH